MPRFLYTALLYLLMPFIVLRMIWRGISVHAYFDRMGERFGRYALLVRPQSSIWIHAVSVGEVQAAVPLIQLLRKEYPDSAFIITTVTPTGARRVEEIFGKKVTHLYLPFDIPGAVRRFLLTVDPVIGIIMETEIWPNLFHQCHERGVPIIIANARMSESSAKGYQRLRALTEAVLTNVNLIVAQTATDAERFKILSQGRARIEVTGSIKFDLRLPASLYEHAQVLRRQLMKHRPVWIAASTHDGEEEIVLDAMRMILATIPNAILILVPRHPDRTPKLVGLCRKFDLLCARRSKGEQMDDETSVYLGDSLGELLLMLSIADVAFMGGSLVKHGGHNMLEPAALGVPVLTGPHTFNFTDISRMLITAGAAELVDNAEQLAHAVLRYLTDANLRHNAGEQGKRLVESNRGATQKLSGLILDVLKRGK